MGVSREQAIDIAVAHYAGGQSAVVRSRDALADVRVDAALVLTHVTHTGDAPGFDVPGPQVGPGWWVAFEELHRVATGWEPPDFHPSGGLVRVCESSGAVFRPTLL